MTVLVLADELDPTVDRVVSRLNRQRVPVFRCDTGWFPTELTIHAELERGRWVGSLRTRQRAVELEWLHSIWYRSPTAFRFPATMSDTERRDAAREAKLGLGGVLASLPVRWINQPGNEADSSYKPWQLAAASPAGLSVPDTWLSNDPERAHPPAGP